jgi:hypothetical protein
LLRSSYGRWLKMYRGAYRDEESCGL